MAIASIERKMTAIDEHPSPDQGRRHLFARWVGRLIGSPHQSGFRQVYVVENQDWLAPKSNLSDQEAYDAIVDLYESVTDEQYGVAIAELKKAQAPESDDSPPH
ncbi:hypothetical protein [Catenulispora acidiphila]|nr:hypothetical protein [Catenulispora acidiphila]